MNERLDMGNFTSTSYSTIYMLIKNEVKFTFSENNLTLTSPSIQAQFNLIMHKHYVTSTIYLPI